MKINKLAWKNTMSFSLIEILVVIGVLGLVLPSVFGIIFAILKQQVKVMSLAQVKRESDYSLAIMRNVIKNNAVSVYSDDLPTPTVEECKTQKTSSPVSVVSFKDKDGAYFKFFSEKVIPDNNDHNKDYFRIASDSSYLSRPANLFTPKVRIARQDATPKFRIQCSRSGSYSTPIISISFTAEFNTLSLNPEENSSISYQTNVKMKNY